MAGKEGKSERPRAGKNRERITARNGGPDRSFPSRGCPEPHSFENADYEYRSDDLQTGLVITCQARLQQPGPFCWTDKD